MFWVVVGHSFIGKAGEGPVWENALFHFAYSFHMPLFMLVSGWLFYLTRLKANGETHGKKWTWGAILKDKAVRLLLPGLVFSVISFVLKLAFPSQMSRQIGLNSNDVIHSILYPYDNPFREFWFIATLFCLFLLSPLWKFVLRREWTKWGMLALLTVSHFLQPQIELLCIGRVIGYAVWFYLGLLISAGDWVDKYIVCHKWIILIIGIVIYVATRSLVHGSIVSFMGTLGGITLSFGYAMVADKYIPNLFCGFRNYTYQIFLMGILAQMFVKIVYRHVSVPYVAAYIICILAGLYVPVLVSKLIEKIGWKPLSLCVGLK